MEGWYRTWSRGTNFTQWRKVYWRIQQQKISWSGGIHLFRWDKVYWGMEGWTRKWSWDLLLGKWGKICWKDQEWETKWPRNIHFTKSWYLQGCMERWLSQSRDMDFS